MKTNIDSHDDSGGTLVNQANAQTTQIAITRITRKDQTPNHVDGTHFSLDYYYHSCGVDLPQKYL
jgi:hypothetical protein